MCILIGTVSQLSDVALGPLVMILCSKVPYTCRFKGKMHGKTSFLLIICHERPKVIS